MDQRCHHVLGGLGLNHKMILGWCVSYKNYQLQTAGTKMSFSSDADNVLKQINKTLEEINITLKVLTDQAAAAAAASNKNVMVAAAETSGSGGGASRSRFEDEDIKYNKYTVTMCLGILDNMTLYWSGDGFLRILKLLQEIGWREMFIEMSDEQRRRWVISV